MQYTLGARYRQVTWQARVLPSFIIVGAQRSGTSSLYYYLSQHPQLVPSYLKEVHFFDGGLKPDEDTFNKGLRWYRSHFPLREDLGPQQQTFEASPLYLFNPLAPKRIAELLPGVRLIVLLRNPTERAISHYFHEQQKGHEALPIAEALQAEEQRLKPVLEVKDYKSQVFIRHSYKSRGLYSDQLHRYLSHFGVERILVINSESFFSEPATALRRVFAFLGVEPTAAITDWRPRNVASSRSQIPTAAREYLSEFFRPHNQALFELIEEDYGW